jgi:hypothetical protein
MDCKVLVETAFLDVDDRGGRLALSLFIFELSSHQKDIHCYLFSDFSICIQEPWLVTQSRGTSLITSCLCTLLVNISTHYTSPNWLLATEEACRPEVPIPGVRLHGLCLQLKKSGAGRQHDSPLDLFLMGLLPVPNPSVATN